MGAEKAWSFQRLPICVNSSQLTTNRAEKVTEARKWRTVEAYR